MVSNVIESEHGSKTKETKREVDTTPGDTNVLVSASHNRSDAGDASSPLEHKNLHDKPRSKSERTQPKPEEKTQPKSKEGKTQPKSEEKTQPKSEEGKNTAYGFKEPSEDDDSYDKAKGQPKPKRWETEDGMRGDRYHPPGSWYLGSGVWIEPDHPLY